MKSRTALLISLTLFAGGVGSGWIMSIKMPGLTPKPGPAIPAGLPAPVSPQALAIPGMPEPSGLPGDLIHLEEIHDPRILRAAWLAAEAEGGDRWPLAQRWATLDPEGVVRFLLVENVNGAPRDDFQGNLLLENWLEKDPADALRFLGKSTGATARRFWFLNARAVFAAAMQARLKDAPEETMALFRAGSPTVKALMCEQVFEHLFTANPAQALTEMENIPPSLRYSAWNAVDKATDPGSLLKLLGESKNTGCSPHTYAEIFKTYAEGNADAARSMAESMPPGPRREAVCTVILRKMAETDPEAALSWMETHAPSPANREKVYDALAKENPALALELCSGNQVPFSYEVRKCIQDLSAKDWPAAENLVSTAPSARARNRIISALAYGLNTERGTALSDLPKLGALLTQVRTEKDETVLQRHQFSGNTSEELPALMEWVSRQPAKAMDEILPPLADRLRNETPEAAAAWLTQLPPGPVRTEALIQNTSKWATANPQAAAQFSQSLPPGTDRDYAVLNTALAWQRNDPAAARQWLESLPDSSAKTRVLKELENLVNPP